MQEAQHNDIHATTEATTCSTPEGSTGETDAGHMANQHPPAPSRPNQTSGRNRDIVRRVRARERYLVDHLAVRGVTLKVDAEDMYLLADEDRRLPLPSEVREGVERYAYSRLGKRGGLIRSLYAFADANGIVGHSGQS